jgi:hypothetical protein
MIEVVDGDLCLLDAFRLKWRWTDPKCQQFPPDILAEMTAWTIEAAVTESRKKLEKACLSKGRGLNA